MAKLKIGILREHKIPADNRTPLTPRQCAELKEKYPELDIIVQWSPVRCFTEEEYEKFGIKVSEDVSHCDLLLGIKEVKPDKLVENKTYMFFSHTIKKQPHNQKMLQEIIRKNITLIDYELLTDTKGNRLIGFGRWAGIVGAHYALLMLGERTGAYKLKPANKCVNLQELTDQYDLVKFPNARFVITGGGRVANGALEIMLHANIRQVSVEEFLTKDFDEPVYVLLRSEHLYRPKGGGKFDRRDFYNHPENYESDFKRFISKTDVLINCMYWSPLAPRLFEKDEVGKNFHTKIISDVSCDVDGSVPLTTHSTTTDDPIFGYHTGSKKEGIPYQKDTIDVMAIANLPNELPCDASRDFGYVMMETVIPCYLKNPDDELFERATIVKNGKLTERFEYLRDYVEGK